MNFSAGDLADFEGYGDLLESLIRPSQSPQATWKSPDFQPPGGKSRNLQETDAGKGTAESARELISGYLGQAKANQRGNAARDAEKALQAFLKHTLILVSINMPIRGCFKKIIVKLEVSE